MSFSFELAFPSLDRQFYLPGEFIMGAIVLNNPVQCRAMSLELVFEGHRGSTVSVTTSSDEGSDTTEYKQADVYPQLKLMLMQFPDQTWLPGVFKIPFQLQIPIDAPSVFHRDQHGSSIHITYQLIGLLHLDPSKSLRNEIPVKIAAALPPMTPLQANTKAGFLLSLGEMKLSADLDRNLLTPGQPFNFTMRVDNGTSKTIKKVKVEIKSKVQVTAQGHRADLSERLCKLKLPNSEFKKSDTRAFSVTIPPLAPGKCAPYITSPLCTATAELHIRADVAFATDPTLVFPITLCALPF
eukprot:TRINITY_DN11526_c0_g1::TRINITY_DN11526_c0_g1_i1::g.22057::m.22057 TRINITY_DN11526_c0_g1::TRINITY_DN11526_c0_g1_i1::g.22057  ORF type:complete len:297 (+),score=20.47,sp/A6NEK1/ARRD5_HUMAN/25.60/4e-07,Arrestin_C/PF02752.17/4.9,Arrestin_C/PF02752.17/1.5e-08,Arrestin_N/PF00339.24/1.7e-07,Arrestin_N/PF00339.24/7.8,Spo0M/PF07070.6/2.1e+02,Spo0M/PF07070.6/0.0023,A2M_N/PF01835.14/5.2,A2M_N/PF01835.14/0.88 TRINITY_DN11526_c0_g1_i1:57-947(+)